MKIIILHGFAEIPQMYWLPWLRTKLEERGHEVWAPLLPDPLKPDLKKWLKVTAPQAANWGEDTIIIGHSMGGVLALRLLEQVLDRPVRAVITVGTPYASTLKLDWFMTFFGQPIDWSKIRGGAQDFVFIQADNDPVVPADHALRYHEQLGGRLVRTRSDMHFLGPRAPVIWRELETFLK